MSLDLDFKRLAHLRIHNIGAHAGLGGWRPVSVRQTGDAYTVTTEGRDVRVPSALRWRMFRYGWQARIARLSEEFGLGDPFQIQEGDTVIDIGANVGEFALAAAALGANVHAIEGDPKVFECLVSNTRDVPNITAYQQILWKSEEILTFYSAPNRADSSIFAPSKEAVAIELPARRLDDLVSDAGIEDVALLKCDAEGAEPEVLQGATSVLARTRAVAVDTGPERAGEETGEAVAVVLEDAGFTVTHTTRVRRKITFARR